ncbi:MAG: hypothetical protein H7838_00855 [Magnetococcus sp. DMHC-8]
MNLLLFDLFQFAKAVENKARFRRENATDSDQARQIDISIHKIIRLQCHGKRVWTDLTGNLADNQIVSGQLSQHQCWSAFIGGEV